MESIDFRLEDVMDNLANLITLKTEEKGLELLFDVKADLPTALVGDPLRLGQVLINLGNNAAKFTERARSSSVSRSSRRTSTGPSCISGSRTPASA
jgi:signal transduction histidine kinase